jgi:Domain of unknown function (DUF4203)
MLPASLQTPAALILLTGGILSCFAGYRIFRVVLGIYGFILGALIASSVMGSDSTGWMLLAALGGGLAGALILIFAYFFGVALLGAAIGAFTAHIIWSAMGSEPHVAIVIVLSIAGALAALALQRYVIIGATGFAGAWTAIVGALALTGSRVAAQGAREDVWAAYPLDPAPGSTWVIVAWIALGLIGVMVQLMVTGKKRRRT